MSYWEIDELDKALHERAAQTVGFDDFGDDSYREGLRRVIADIAETRGGGDTAWALSRFLVLPLLVSRLYSELGWQQHPEVLGTRIARPVVIVGIPRTGTTLTHKLLSSHEDFQVLENWLISTPMVRPPREVWADLPEYRAKVDEVGSQPAQRHMTHFVAADEADECIMLTSQSFVGTMFGTAMRLPAYDAWMFQQDYVPTLRRHADNLRLIGAGDPRRWLLKNPSHLQVLDSLFTVYPDAKIVWMHRDPQEAMASLADMLRFGQGEDGAARLERELHLWARAVEHAEAVRSEHPDAFFDVDYRALTADPMEPVGKLLAWLGISESSATDARMRAWLRDNPQGKHGVHRYDPTEQGVDEATIRALFGPYMDRYGFA